MRSSNPRLSSFFLSLLFTGVCAIDATSQVGPPPEATEIGTGCPGVSGLSPRLQPAEGQLPFAGETYTSRVDFLPTDVLGTMIVMLGFSSSDWAGTPLPLDLTDLGMPGCTLYMSIDFYQSVVNVAGTRFWTIFIPRDQVLVGVPFYQQIYVPDSRVNLLGGIVSNATEAIIGAREK